MKNIGLQVKLPGGFTRPATAPSIFNVPTHVYQLQNHLPGHQNKKTNNWSTFKRKIKSYHSLTLFLTRSCTTNMIILLFQDQQKDLCVSLSSSNYQECKLTVIVDKKPTLCSPLVFSAFKNGISVPLGRILNPNNGLSSYSQFYAACQRLCQRTRHQAE